MTKRIEFIDALRVSPFLAHHLFGEKYREKG